MFADDSELLHRIAEALIQRGEQLGTAESCTGGLIAAASPPGPLSAPGQPNG